MAAPSVYTITLDPNFFTRRVTMSTTHETTLVSGDSSPYSYSVITKWHNSSRGKKTNNATKKPPLTHFLCIPLVNPTSQPQLEASIRQFKEDVCTVRPVETSPETASVAESTVKDVIAQGESPSENIGETTTPTVQALTITEQAIRPLGSLHLTLGVMSLDEEKLSQATTLLQSLDLETLLQKATSDQADQTSPEISHESLSTNPLTISLSSLEPMQSPTKTSILYIVPTDATNRLYPLCSALRNTFTSAGLLVPDNRPLNLHATLVNTIYIKGRKKKKKATTSNPASKTENTNTTTTTQTGSTEDKLLVKECDIKANDPSSGHGPAAKSSLYLDASSLLPRYKSHIWASEIPISRLAICEMGTKKQFDSTGNVIGEAYTEVAVREF
ncbi:hypothetical protein E4T39_07493 [Aureobasidium subglaciale]|nr:hypothetical protein E4T39_07493 [Aureobasidium subglaciale]